MQLAPVAAAALAACLILPAIAPADAQSLSPMRREGNTPTDVKAFRVVVGNPYKRRMTFVAAPMDPTFVHPATSASASPPEFRLAPGASRPVVLQFRVDSKSKERTIGLCIYPKDLEGPVLPRVCGTYTGRLVSGVGG